MSGMSQHLGDPRRQGERAVNSKAFEALARAGFVARAAIYGIIGVLAIKVATGPGGETTDQQGALREIRQQSSGEVLLIVVVVGLAGYALWRLARAALGHGPEGIDDAGDRIAALISGIAYAILCAVAVGILLGGSGSSDESETTAGVLGWTGGVAVVTVFGVGMIGAGIYQAYKGIARKFVEDSKTEQMNEPVRRAFVTLGVVGHTSRAVIFVLVGWFLARAALEYDASEAKGLDGALSELAQAEHGSLVLGIVAAGLIAFALYSLADARYRRA